MIAISKYYTVNEISFIDLKYSGIYKITNTINNKFYIGSSKYLQKRFYSHLSDFRKEKSHCTILKKAVDKYGEENFNFEVLARCPEEYLILLEQWFINNLNPQYNARKIADSNRGCKRSKQSVELNRKSGKERWQNQEYREHMIKQMQKYTWKKGSGHHCSKINEETAKKIKLKLSESSMTCREISLEFNCSLNIVKDIKRGRTWKHITI